MTLDPGWNEPIFKHTQTKRQHIVPRMYLQAFTRADGRIRVIDLQEEREYVASLRNAAVETGFYDVDLRDQTVSAEDWLARLESEVSSILSILRRDPTAITTLVEEQEDVLARYIVAQFFRTQVRRRDIGRTVAKFSSEFNRMARPIMMRKLGEHFDAAVFDKWHSSLLQGKYDEEEKAQSKLVNLELLREVQGFGNLLRASPWRIGNVAGPLRLYTSDNPVAQYRTPVRSRWDFGGFWSYEYFFPLSPDVLLKIERRPDSKDSMEPAGAWGHRRCKDFPNGEVSMARHIISLNANRFLYGEGQFVSRECAETCIRQVEQARWDFALQYLGYNPNAPPNEIFCTLNYRRAAGEELDFIINYDIKYRKGRRG